MKATSGYAQAMQAHFAALRGFTEALRNDLFRYGNPYADDASLENAFNTTLDAVWQAHEDMSGWIQREVRADRENHDLVWPHGEVKPYQRILGSHYWRDVAAEEISDEEVEEIIEAAIKGGTSVGFANQWDLGILTPPPGYKSQREFLTDVMIEIQGALNGEEWQFVLMLIREELVKVILDQTYTIRDAVIPWRERSEREELRKDREWNWQVVIDNQYGLRMVLEPYCGDEVAIEGEELKRLELDVWLDGPNQKILAVRDDWASNLLVNNAAKDLADKIHKYGTHPARGQRLRVNWSRSCADEIEAIFERDREEGSRRISERLAQTEEWRNRNAAIDLGEAHIKSWLRMILYDAAEQEPAIADLLSETTMRSPERLMREENMTLWEALEESSRQIVQMRQRLKQPAIVEWLRSGYGYGGVMRTMYLGIDPVPSVQVAPDTR